MRVHVETMLCCPAEKVWEEVQRPALHREIIRPLFPRGFAAIGSVDGVK